MRLYTSTTSPYGRMTRITVAEKADPSACEIVFVDPWARPPEVTENNPLLKVPILVPPGGGPIVDSRVICECLDRDMAGPRLIPEDPGARTEALTLAAIATGGIDAGVVMITPKRVDPEIKSAKLDAYCTRKALGVAAHLGGRVGDSGFLHGDALSLADIATVCFLGFFDFRFPEVDWRGASPRLAEWRDAMARRPSVAETVPG